MLSLETLLKWCFLKLNFFKSNFGTYFWRTLKDNSKDNISRFFQPKNMEENERKHGEKPRNGKNFIFFLEDSFRKAMKSGRYLGVILPLKGREELKPRRTHSLKIIHIFGKQSWGLGASRKIKQRNLEEEISIIYHQLLLSSSTNKFL